MAKTVTLAADEVAELIRRLEMLMGIFAEAFPLVDDNAIATLSHIREFLAGRVPRGALAELFEALAEVNDATLRAGQELYAAYDRAETAIRAFGAVLDPALKPIITEPAELKFGCEPLHRFAGGVSVT